MHLLGMSSHLESDNGKFTKLRSEYEVHKVQNYSAEIRPLLSCRRHMSVQARKQDEIFSKLLILPAFFCYEFAFQAQNAQREKQRQAGQQVTEIAYNGWSACRES